MGLEAHARPPGRGIPSTVTMVVLENGHYYLVRSTPRPLERRLDLEAVDTMLPRDTDLPDGLNPPLPGQLPDPLTAIVSGRARTWPLGHALYCLWLSAQRRWQHTKEWSATWRFQLDGRQQAEIIPPHDWVNPQTTDNLCPVLAIHQIRALAAGQVSPAIHTEEEARAAHAALVSEIFAALRTALVRYPGNPAIP